MHLYQYQTGILAVNSQAFYMVAIQMQEIDDQKWSKNCSNKNESFTVWPYDNEVIQVAANCSDEFIKQCDS